MRKLEGGGLDFDAKSSLINEFMLMKCSQPIIDFEVSFSLSNVVLRHPTTVSNGNYNATRQDSIADDV